MSGRTTRNNPGGRYSRIVAPQGDDSSDEENRAGSSKSQRAKTSGSGRNDAKTFKKPPTPTSSSQRHVRSTQPTQSSQSQRSQRRQQEYESDEENSEDAGGRKELPLKDIVKRLCQFFTTGLGKSSVKKSELLNVLMNKQKKDYPIAMKKARRWLKTYGLRLIGIKEDKEKVICDMEEATSFIIVNNFRQQSIIQSHKNRNQSMDHDVFKAALVFILSLIYMTDRAATEDALWDYLEKFEFTGLMCKKREEFKRVLKTEYEDHLYLLRKEEQISPEQPDKHSLYTWGIRAKAEFSQYAILKFVAKAQKLRPEDFVTHFSKLSPEDVKRIDKEEERIRQWRERRENSMETPDADESGTAPQAIPSQSQVDDTKSKSKKKRRIIEDKESDSD